MNNLIFLAAISLLVFSSCKPEEEPAFDYNSLALSELESCHAALDFPAPSWTCAELADILIDNTLTFQSGNLDLTLRMNEDKTVEYLRDGGFYLYGQYTHWRITENCCNTFEFYHADRSSDDSKKYVVEELTDNAICLHGYLDVLCWVY